jgi:hypothetical protein
MPMTGQDYLNTLASRHGKATSGLRGDIPFEIVDRCEDRAAQAEEVVNRFQAKSEPRRAN